MDFDAVVLAGGRGSRLGGVSKAQLRQRGMSLLSLALRATAGARNVIVVGDVERAPGYRVARENPPYAGPVAAIAAGLSALGPESSPLTLVLACDMPGAVEGVELLLKHTLDLHLLDGAIAVDANNREQYLLALYSTAALANHLATMVVNDASMRQLRHGMNLERVLVPAGSTADVDTWADAATLGVTR
jgi:molybdopterin-guanine dinucleotide biosynthesis protein A